MDMKLPINCPLCCAPTATLKNINESKPGKDLYCEECNTSFTVTLLESENKLEKEHDDLYFHIYITVHANDANLDRKRACILCGKYTLSLFDPAKCTGCGALYSIEDELIS